jgi:hypothetical protein
MTDSLGALSAQVSLGSGIYFAVCSLKVGRTWIGHGNVPEFVYMGASTPLYSGVNYNSH